jgi:hypothetical protein
MSPDFDDPEPLESAGGFWLAAFTWPESGTRVRVPLG